MTKRQRQLATAIIDHQFEHNGRAPTLRELAELLGISFQAASQMVDRMVKRGVIERVPGESRSLRVVGAKFPYTGPEPPR